VTTQNGDASSPDIRWTIPVTPERLRTVVFGRAPFGRRGYNEEEVQRFLSRVAEDISNSDAEKARLRAEIERLRNYYRNAGVNVDDRATRPTPSPQAIATMTRAQQAADSQIAQAEEYARRLVAEARRRYEEVIHHAQRQAAMAAEQVAVAYREHHNNHANGDEQEHLERRVVWLRAFAEITHIQLKSTLEALSREVDKLGKVPAESVATAGYAVGGQAPGYSTELPAM
jgi:DivIVA domain-containing protein